MYRRWQVGKLHWIPINSKTTSYKLYTMSLGLILTFYFSWKIIISLYLFKRVVYYMGGSPLRGKVAQMLK